MPELANRSQYEDRIVRALRPVFRAIRRDAEDSLRQVGWGQHVRTMADVVGPILAEVYAEAGQALHRWYVAAKADEALVSIGLDRQRLELEADQWSRERASALASSVAANSQAELEKLAAKAAVERADRKKVAAALVVLFSKERMLSIAITEVTRAVTAGEGGASLLFLDDGHQVMKAFWQTERDARVCRVCHPLDGQPPEVWRTIAPAGPPAHPHCRCSLNYRLILRQG